MKEIAKFLGLKEDATETEIAAALNTMKVAANGNTEKLTLYQNKITELELAVKNKKAKDDDTEMPDGAEIADCVKMCNKLMKMHKELSDKHDDLRKEHDDLKERMDKISKAHKNELAVALVDKYKNRLGETPAKEIIDMWVEKAESDLTQTENLLKAIPFNKKSPLKGDIKLNKVEVKADEDYIPIDNNNPSAYVARMNARNLAKSNSHKN